MLRVHFLLVVLLFSSIASAQAAPANLSTKPSPVTVGFFVWDRDKHPYASLEQGDLTVLDNKQFRSIVSLKKGSELPLRLGFLIDASNSQRKSDLYKPAVLAGWNFVGQILKRPDDKVFVEKVTIDHEASEFMSMPQFKNYVLHAEPEGATALFDGVSFACDSRFKTDGAWPSRRVLVVLSDGDDNQSHQTREESIAAAQETGVVIFSVSTAEESSARYSPGPRGETVLEHFAEETGGEAFLHLTPKKIEQSFTEISEALNNMYFVTFEPADGSKKGIHRIELKVSGKDKLRLRAPKSYYLQ